MSWKRTRPLAAAAILALVAGCGGGGSSPSYPTPAVDAPLGPARASDGTTRFRVWAPAAGAVSVLFFDTSTSSAPSATQPMAKDLTGGGDVDKDGWNGVWTAEVAGVPVGQLYQYAVGGQPVLDPYAPSMGQFDSGTQRVGMGAVVDPSAVGPESLAGPGAAAWVPFTAPAGYAKREDAIVYEVHVRDFTILASGLTHPPGTYEAFAEKLGHVQALGATHVQLLPVTASYYGDESRRATVELAESTSGNNYNWGYDPQSWFAPEGMYASDPADPVARVRELQTLVNEAHRLGLGVILDVVYNHTASQSILEPLAPGYFYRGSNASGTGNDTASERKMMRKLVVDSIRHLTAAYHVDGFRFDLMGLLDSKTILDAYAAARAVNPAVLFIGEGWRMSGVPPRDDQGNAITAASQDWMTATDDAAVFSDSFRDLMKGGGFGEESDTNAGFLTLASVDAAQLLRNLQGDPTNFSADDPGDAVQYLTAHDGLTLHDKISKVLRLNPDTKAGEDEIARVARVGFVLQSTAQGIDFIHGGCEMGRTKRVSRSGLPSATASNTSGVYFVYNSYDSSDAVNAYRWDAWLAAGSAGAGLEAYVAGLLALRRSTDAFRLGTRALASSHVAALDLSHPNAIAYRADDSAGAYRYLVLANASTSPVVLDAREDVSGAEVLVDQAQAGTTPIASPAGLARSGTKVTLQPRAAAVLRLPLASGP
jgi:secreted pullulanase